MLLIGYTLALQEHGIVDPVRNFSRDFGEYLQPRYPWANSIGPIGAIMQDTSSSSAAWDMFWQLVDEYRIHLGLRLEECEF
jgi:hypothetical protein